MLPHETNTALAREHCSRNTAGGAKRLANFGALPPLSPSMTALSTLRRPGSGSQDTRATLDPRSADSATDGPVRDSFLSGRVVRWVNDVSRFLVSCEWTVLLFYGPFLNNSMVNLLFYMAECSQLLRDSSGFDDLSTSMSYIFGWLWLFYLLACYVALPVLFLTVLRQVAERSLGRRGHFPLAVTLFGIVHGFWWSRKPLQILCSYAFCYIFGGSPDILSFDYARRLYFNHYGVVRVEDFMFRTSTALGIMCMTLPLVLCGGALSLCAFAHVAIRVEERLFPGRFDLLEYAMESLPIWESNSAKARDSCLEHQSVSTKLPENAQCFRRILLALVLPLFNAAAG